MSIIASVQEARARLIRTVRSGEWERLASQVDAYGAAVRADERRRVLDDTVKTLREVFDAGCLDSEQSATCLAAVERLY